ncbi:unnamed protein product, partial [Allacma fusca]
QYILVTSVYDFYLFLILSYIVT